MVISEFKFIELYISIYEIVIECRPCATLSYITCLWLRSTHFLSLWSNLCLSVDIVVE